MAVLSSLSRCLKRSEDKIKFMALPININNLVNGKTIEWDRIEFKEGWNPEDILHTMCAFANDINNWGGGYIIVGIAEKDGKPMLPPKGIEEKQIDKIQKELLQLTHLIDPFYAPVTEPVEHMGKRIFIIWAPGGMARPYKVPTTLSTKGQKQYYIRRGSSSVLANHGDIKQLMELAATVPFDDRINHHSVLNDLDLGLIREFLQEIESDLFDQSASMPFEDLCRQMRIVDGSNEYLKPINAGLLFFNRHPEKFFRGAITEVIQFKDNSGTEFTENRFDGPIQMQANAVLNYLKNNIITEKIVKVRYKPQANRFFNFPFEAVEEAVINAYYHRSYEHGSSIEINIRPDKIEILSFPGPLPPLDNESFKRRIVVSRDYRNRRIGDFLKDLDLTEGRGTGIPKIYQAMEKNGSPSPIFEIDKDKISFLVILPIHPSFLRDLGRDQTLSPSKMSILLACMNGATSKSEIAAKIGLSARSGTLNRLLPNLITEGLLEYTIPGKPNSRLQKYSITAMGYAYLEA